MCGGDAGRGSGKTGRGRVLKLERGEGGRVMSCGNEAINTFFPFLHLFKCKYLSVFYQLDTGVQLAQRA